MAIAGSLCERQDLLELVTRARHVLGLEVGARLGEQALHHRWHDAASRLRIHGDDARRQVGVGDRVRRRTVDERFERPFSLLGAAECDEAERSILVRFGRLAAFQDHQRFVIRGVGVERFCLHQRVGHLARGDAGAGKHKADEAAHAGVPRKLSSRLHRPLMSTATRAASCSDTVTVVCFSPNCGCRNTTW